MCFGVCFWVYWLTQHKEGEPLSYTKNLYKLSVVGRGDAAEYLMTI